jgi:ATP-dependent Lhr-like helicase
MHESLRQFHPVVGRWFEERVGVPTPPQVLGWPVVAGGGAGKSALILAPTGSGKTLAAFLGAIDWLVRRLIQAEAAGKSVWGVQILYVSPLKSLANDVQKNLMKPLGELAEVARGMGVEWPEIHVGVRTGDTPQRERAAMVRRPPHILITTPESLNLLLTTGGRAGLAGVKFLIVDEVHALAGSKRGVFLSLVMERLEEERKHEGTKTRRSTKGGGKGVKIAPGVYVGAEEVGEMVRIGLSATARPEEVIGGWLAGCDEKGELRPMEIVRAGQRKRLDLGVVCPFGGEEELALTPEERKEKGVGHWPEVTRAVLTLIREHRSTLVFANSRRLIERMAGNFIEVLEQEQLKRTSEPRPSGSGRLGMHGQSLPDGRGSETLRILPHHGSISKEVRLETEQALKRGELDAVLATSSLELGIDVGALDLVVQVDSPGNVAGALQRVGRAGHLEKATAKGRLLARTLQELPSLGALVPLMVEGVVEETRVPVNCLDVLAQQIVAACVARPWKRGELYRVLRRAMPYRGLTEKQFDNVVGMLSKRAERVTSQGLRPRLSFDRVNDELIIMPGAGKVLLMNSGVISDTGQFAVYLAGATRGKVETGGKGEVGSRKLEEGGAGPGVRLGELDEEFVYETKEGDRIILGSQTWRVVRIDSDRVLVEAAAPGSSRMPFWRGESAPRSELLGEAVAGFHGEMERRSSHDGEESVREWLMGAHRFDEQAAENAIGYYRRQIASAGVPTLGKLVVEHFVDRTGEPVVAVLSPWGSRVNYALRLALEQQFAKRRLPAQLVHNDDGILIRPPVEVGEIPENPLAWLRAGTLEQEITDQLEATALFGLRFRQNAARALMLPRMNVTQRTPLWQQRLRARHLLALVKKQRNFPIIVETYRECLQDVLGIERVVKLLGAIERGQMSVSVVRNAEPSPFARALWGQFQATYLYAQDDPLHGVQGELAIDQTILDDILQRRIQGGEETVETPTWTPVDEIVLDRRISGADYPARTGEELLEKIEAAGAAGVGLGGAEDARWQTWVAGDAADVGRMLGELTSRRRIVVVEKRWVAVENLAVLVAARGEKCGLEDLEGKKIPWKEIPPAVVESVLSREAARRVVVEQVMKRRPVMTMAEVVKEVPWMEAKEMDGIVEELVREGVVQKIGEGRMAWGEFVEQLRGIALRRERKAAATADVAALQRHLLRWQYVEAPRGGVEALEDVLDMLMGVSAPLSVWENELLPARIAGFAPAMLDGICRSGRRVWVGGDGSGGGEMSEEIAFWPRHLLGERPMALGGVEASALSANAGKVLEFLKTSGASFLVDLQIALTMEDAETALALEELVRRGVVSNDHLESLREIGRVAASAWRDRARREAAARHAAKESRYGAMGAGRSQRRGINGWRRTQEGQSLGGRWFLLPVGGQRGTEQAALELAERAADRVERLLRRTAFACRELIEPAIDGAWRDCYDVLTRMEWAGTVRRGYFVEGITGSQFALPGVHLEGRGDGGGANEVVWLSMVDPANVWARVATRWLSDSGEGARVARVQGNWIALMDGRPVLAAVNWGQRLIPLPGAWEQQEKALKTVASLLSRMPRSERAHFEVLQWDQRDIVGSPAEEILRHQGFARDTQGLRLYRQYIPQPAAQTTP